MGAKGATATGYAATGYPVDPQAIGQSVSLFMAGANQIDTIAQNTIPQAANSIQQGGVQAIQSITQANNVEQPFATTALDATNELRWWMGMTPVDMTQNLVNDANSLTSIVDTNVQANTGMALGTDQQTGVITSLLTALENTQDPTQRASLKSSIMQNLAADTKNSTLGLGGTHAQANAAAASLQSPVGPIMSNGSTGQMSVNQSGNENNQQGINIAAQIASGIGTPAAQAAQGVSNSGGANGGIQNGIANVGQGNGTGNGFAQGQNLGTNSVYQIFGQPASNAAPAAPTLGPPTGNGNQIFGQAAMDAAPAAFAKTNSLPFAITPNLTQNQIQYLWSLDPNQIQAVAAANPQLGGQMDPQVNAQGLSQTSAENAISGLQNNVDRNQQISTDQTIASLLNTYAPTTPVAAPTSDQIFAKLQTEPGYATAYAQGTQALQRQQAAGGILNSGNAALEAQSYGQNFANTAYQQQLQNLSGLVSGMMGSVNQQSGAYITQAAQQAQEGLASAQNQVSVANNQMQGIGNMYSGAGNAVINSAIATSQNLTQASVATAQNMTQAAIATAQNKTNASISNAGSMASIGGSILGAVL